MRKAWLERDGEGRWAVLGAKMRVVRVDGGYGGCVR